MLLVLQGSSRKKSNLAQPRAPCTTTHLWNWFSCCFEYNQLAFSEARIRTSMQEGLIRYKIKCSNIVFLLLIHAIIRIRPHHPNKIRSKYYTTIICKSTRTLTNSNPVLQCNSLEVVFLWLKQLSTNDTALINIFSECLEYVCISTFDFATTTTSGESTL